MFTNTNENIIHYTNDHQISQHMMLYTGITCESHTQKQKINMKQNQTRLSAIFRSADINRRGVESHHVRFFLNKKCEVFFE